MAAFVATSWSKVISFVAGLLMLPTPVGTSVTRPNWVWILPVIVTSQPMYWVGLPAGRAMPATNSALDVLACGSRVALCSQRPESPL